MNQRTTWSRRPRGFSIVAVLPAETIFAIDIIYGIFMMLVPTVIAAVLSEPIVHLSWKRIDWHPAYVAVFVVPYGVWLLALLVFPIHGKSMSNFVVEVGSITLAVPVALLIHALLGRRISTRWGVAGVVCAVSVVALVAYFAVSPLPE
jgi:hypothetical protein